MLYTHVLNRGLAGVRGPADRLFVCSVGGADAGRRLRVGQLREILEKPATDGWLHSTEHRSWRSVPRPRVDWRRIHCA